MIDGAKVTIDNFRRAETDNYFAKHTRDAGGLGRFYHLLTPTQVEYQPVIRMNRDTLYSGAVLDLTQPATVTFPDARGRFMSMMVVNQDHYVKYVTYEAGEHKLTEQAMGTRYAEVICRTFVDPDSPEDIAAANALQQGITIRQKAVGVLELPEWDQTTLDGCRKALVQLGAYQPNNDRAFGDMDEVEPTRHLIATARGWGGNRLQDAMYSIGYPDKNDGQTPYELRLKNVPVDGFWSVSLYNKDGYFEKNARSAYSVNNITAAANRDGSYTIRFGGDPDRPNYLGIMPGWNYTLRLYRPRKELVDGTWPIPGARPVDA